MRTAMRRIHARALSIRCGAWGYTEAGLAPCRRLGLMRPSKKNQTRGDVTNRMVCAVCFKGYHKCGIELSPFGNYELVTDREHVEYCTVL